MPNFEMINGNLVLNGITWKPVKVTLSTNADDYQITSSVLLLKLTASVQVTGFDGALIFGEDREGTMIWLRNKSPTHTLTLVHDATSAAGSRIYVPSETNFVVAPRKQAFLLYDTDEDDANPGWWVFE